MTLTEFLLVRVTEDEANVWDMSLPDRPRWLAECEAKRRIVELHPLVPAMDVGVPGDGTGCENCHVLDKVHDDAIVEALGPCDTLRALALPYATHPDCDEAWRP